MISQTASPGRDSGTDGIPTPRTGALRVDRQTLAELEILRARDRHGSIFDGLNRTTTRAGTRKLRERLLNPMSDPRLLEACFDGIRYLVDRDPVDRDPADRDLDIQIPEAPSRALEWYIGSSWDTLSDRGMAPGWIEASWIALRHRGLLEHAREGLAATAELLDAILPLARSLSESEVPAALRLPARSILSLVQKLDLERHLKARRRQRVLATDALLRTKHRGDLFRLIDQMAELDVYGAAARLVRSGWTIPQSLPGDTPRIEGDGLRHPYLDDAIANPVRLTPEAPVLFLTGPNMAGKTTYLRSVALSTYLAHCGWPVPAETFAFTPLDALVTSLSPHDDLRSGVSYFQAEVRRVRGVLEHVAAGDRTLAILDEVFRGTNVHDALEASRLVIHGCSRARRSRFIFASHLFELGEELRGLSTVRLASFEGGFEEGRPAFDYRLRDGLTSRRLGLEVLRREGVEALLGQIVDDGTVAPEEPADPRGSADPP